MKNQHFVINMDDYGNPTLQCYIQNYNGEEEWGKLILYHIKTCIYNGDKDKHNRCYKKLVYTADVLNNMGLGAAMLLGLISKEECSKILANKKEWEDKKEKGFMKKVTFQ